MFEFTTEELTAFKHKRTHDLAKECWVLFKKKFPWQVSTLKITNDDEGIKFMYSQLELSNKYLSEAKPNDDYITWQVYFAELAFFLKPNFDKDPLTHHILTMDVFHPFERVDLVLSTFAICIDSKENQDFFEKYRELLL